jgi:ABC-type phosphate/phosphonate transport system permease subunit
VHPHQLKVFVQQIASNSLDLHKLYCHVQWLQPNLRSVQISEQYCALPEPNIHTTRVTSSTNKQFSKVLGPLPFKDWKTLLKSFLTTFSTAFKSGFISLYITFLAAFFWRATIVKTKIFGQLLKL